MKQRFIVLLIILIPSYLFAQDYNVTRIPDSLLKNADVVERLHDTKIIIHSINSATVKNTYALTILNEKGNNLAGYGCLYDNFEKLTEASGKLFDAFGSQVKSVKKKDMEDRAYDDHFSLIGDARVKSHNFYCKIYPYTIEYTQEEEMKGIEDIPSWHTMAGYAFSIQKSIFTIEMPTGYQLRYKLMNGAKEPVIKINEKTKTLQWQGDNIPALVYEPFQPPISSIEAAVLIGLNDFEYGGYSGNLSTWSNYGKFYNALSKGRDVLPEDVKSEVHSLLEGVSDRQQKIKLLYEFLQRNTHYVSIQLGIGGLQTFDATYVAKKKYGDCKALSNYMMSLLKEVGIKAYVAIIHGGDKNHELYADFPKDYFNHVVVCVPFGKDTTWLECTSQTDSPGYSGSFTGNRKALLIGDDGGWLVNTPVYASGDNLQTRKVAAIINEAGNLVANVHTHFTGIQQELPNSLYNNATAETRRKYLNSKLNLPTYDVDKIEYKETKGKIPAMDEFLKVTSENYAIITDKRLFIVPNLFNKVMKIPINKARKFPVVLDDAFRDIDSISLLIPPGYIIESMPKDITIENKFGSYSMSYKIKNGQIELIRAMQQNSATFPPGDYNDLVDYFDVIYKTDRAKIVFVKADGAQASL